jgi:flagellar motor switch protein FliM
MDHGIFTNTEITRILERARSGQNGAGAAASPAKAEPYKFQGATQLSEEQLTKLLDAHVSFSSKLARSLSSQLGAECTVTAAGAVQAEFSVLLEQLQPGAMFGTLQVRNPEATAFLHADLVSVLPMIDLILGGGGVGMPAPEVRPLTEIEQDVFKSVVDLFAAELQTVWAPLVETSIRYAYDAAADAIFPASQRVLAFRFGIQVGDCQGTWSLILPSTVSNILVRNLEQKTSVAGSAKSDGTGRRLRERLLESQFRLELCLPPTTVSVRMLAHLKVGQVVVLKQPSGDPIDVNIEGINLFQALPVACGTRRGAQIQKVFPTATNAEEEKR